MSKKTQSILDILLYVDELDLDYNEIDRLISELEMIKEWLATNLE